MADLTTTITENVVLNGSVRGSTNTLTTSNIVDVFERILTCTHSQTTTVAVFNSTPYGADGDYFTKPSSEDVFEKVYAMMNEVNPTKFPSLY